MMNLEKLVEDLFDDKNLSTDNLRAFTEDVLIRLSLPENNPGSVYSGLITNTSNLYNAFFGKITSEATKKAISEGLTISMETAKGKVIAKLSHLQNLVKYKFTEGSPTYQEFYPLGMSEYHDARIDQLDTILTRFANAAVTHLLGSNLDEVEDLNDKIEAFDNARDAQQLVFAQIENLQTGRREDRKALTLQLTTNMLTIALNNLENPDNFNNYYNPSYLPLTDKAFTASGIIAVGAIAVAVNEGVITQSSDLTLYNNGTDNLIFSISDQPGVIHPEYQITISAGNSQRFAETLPVFEKYYINVQNPSAVNNGKWKVKVS